jgi:SEC-C motif
LQKHLQKELLKGTRATILTNKEISQRMGDSEQRTWAFYRFFSCHTHSTPLSFYRYADQKRDGTENDIEKAYMSEALNFATQVLRRADNDYQKVFSDLVVFKPLKVMNWDVMKRKIVGGAARQRAVPKNRPCPCGSGKKYRWCHGTSKASG